MIIYCTPCSKNKRKDKKSLKAIDRYVSGRIKKIYEKSIADKVEFRIFSGKHGLLKPDENFFWYDEKLTEEKIMVMKKNLERQISENKIRKIIFFVSNPKKNSGVIPYCKALELSCRNSIVNLEIRFL